MNSNKHPKQIQSRFEKKKKKKYMIRGKIIINSKFS